MKYTQYDCSDDNARTSLRMRWILMNGCWLQLNGVYWQLVSGVLDFTWAQTRTCECSPSTKPNCSVFGEHSATLLRYARFCIAQTHLFSLRPSICVSRQWVIATRIYIGSILIIWHIIVQYIVYRPKNMDFLQQRCWAMVSHISTMKDNKKSKIHHQAMLFRFVSFCDNCNSNLNKITSLTKILCFSGHFC